MSKQRKSRNKNEMNYDPQQNSSIEKIAENLSQIANEMKNSTLEEKNYSLQKTVFLCSFIGAILGGLLTIAGIVLSNQANVLVKKNTEPFFHLNAIEENGETLAYQITNDGGQIQSASIILRNYIDVFDRYYTQDHYYFPFAEVSQTFPEQEGDYFTINFEDTYFGIDKWEGDGIINTLRNKLDDADLGAKISYLETMEMQYIDAGRNVVVEYYVIKKDESGELRMYFITPEYRDEIQSLVPMGSDFKFRTEDVFCRKLGTTGSSGGRRGSDPCAQFCQSVIDILKEEISRKTILSFD